MTVAAAGFMLFGVATFLFGEFLVAGLCFLLTSLTIYARETRA